MEARRSSLPEVKQALQEGINRIESMAFGSRYCVPL